MKYLFTALLTICLSAEPNAQLMGSWNAYTSIRTVEEGVYLNDNTVWAITSGGITIYHNDEVERTLTTIDGLSRLDGQSLAYDKSTGNVFVGYINGLIDVIDSESFEIKTLEDIYRNQTFNSKGIYKLDIYQNKLFVATDFGIVEYDTKTLFVNDTYTKLGDLDRGTKINDIFISDNRLTAATNQGVAYINLNDHFYNENWTSFKNGIDIPANNAILTISEHNDKIYASSENANYVYDGTIWSITNIYGDQIINSYQLIDNVLLALNEGYLFTLNNSSIKSHFLSRMFAKNIIKTDKFTDEVLIGTENLGLIKLTLSTNRKDTLGTDGPFRNYFQGIKVEGNKLISGSTQKSFRNIDIDRSMGYYIFDGEQWKNFNHYTNEKLRLNNFRNAFTTLITDKYYYIGTWGRGIARHSIKDDEIEIYNGYNSNIKGWVSDDPNFPVISGIQKDSNDDIWIVSRLGSTPLYMQSQGDEEWKAFSPSGAIHSSDFYTGLFIDSYNQKWISLGNTSSAGRGLLVLDTGDTDNPNDDKAIKLTTDENQGNLPHNKIKAIVEDKTGEVWVGTERGISKFMFVDIMIDGGPNEWKSQWLTNEDTSAVSRYLLRDVNVSAMAVNAANEKWIGSENQGVWLLNAEGSKILKRFTAENSPLFSDAIIDIAISDETGEVYISTDKGLISYYDIPRKPVEKMKELKVYPNPFNYAKSSRIIIEGLAESTHIKILGIDGTVVQEITAKGGRAEWNGYAYDGSRLGSGVYHIIALEENGSMRGSGKVVIIR